MKRFFMILAIFMFFSVSVGATDNSYEFHAEINQHIRNAETLACTLNIDGEIETYNYDKDSRQSEKIFEEEFNDYVSISCNKQINGISLIIYNNEEKVISNQNKRRTRTLSYKLNQKELDLTIINKENINLECNLTYDKIEKEFKFKQTKRESIDIEFVNDYNLKCNNEVDSIKKQIYNKENKEIAYNIYRDIKELSYDKNKINDKELMLFFNDNFEKETSCDIRVDKESWKKYEFNKRIRLSNKQVRTTFSNNFNIKCNNDIKSAIVGVIDARNDKLIQRDYMINTKTYNYVYSGIIKEKTIPTPTINKTIINKTIQTIQKPKPRIIELPPKIIPKKQIKKTILNKTIIDHIADVNKMIENESSTNISNIDISKEKESTPWWIWVILGIVGLIIAAYIYIRD